MLGIEYFMLSGLLVLSFATDARRSVIPNWLTAGGAASGVMLHGLLSGWEGVVHSSTAMGTGFGIMLLLHLAGAVGAGDVKLFGAIGALSAFDFVLSCMFYSIVYAGAIALLVLIWKKRLAPFAEKLIFGYVQIALLKNAAAAASFDKKDMLRFPFMYAVLPGALTAAVLAN